MPRRPGPVLAATTLLAFSAHAPAAHQPAAPTPTPAITAPQPGGEAEAKALLQRTAEKYRALKSYRDTFRVRYDFKTQGEEDMPIQEMTATLRVARPRSVRLENDQGAVVCDGTHLWVHSQTSAEYTEAAAPETMSAEEVGTGGAAFMLPSHPLTDALLGHPAPLLLEDLKSVDSAAPEARAGEPGRRIKGRGTYPQMAMGDDSTFPMTLWISDRSGLIGEITLDITDSMKKMYAEMEEMQAGEDEEGGYKPPKITQALIVMTFENAAADPDLPADTFTFRPGPEDKKVDELTSPWERDAIDQDLLVGHPAPEFEGTLLDGKSLKLADLRGKVVLLDFWATWCGPCVQAIPHIQGLAEKFADKPVAVLGMNRDQPGSEDRIRKFLEKKKITFPQFLDFEGTAAEKYGVTGIPCTVLIDAKGVLQHVSVGFSRGHDAELAEHIETLLAGKDLFDPAKVSATPPTPGEREKDEPAPAVTASTGDVNPDSLVIGEPLTGIGYVNQWQSRRCDIDGDGREELVCADMNNGGLVALAADGASATKIKLRGGSRNEGIQSFEPVRLGSETYWLVSRTAWSGGNSSKCSLTLHNPDGSAAWTFKPELAPKASCQFQAAAADLTGDGKPEIVLGISEYTMKKTSANSYTHQEQAASIAILDWDGNLLAQRRVGKQLLLLFVGNPASPGESPRIVVGTDQRVRRFTFDPSRTTTDPVAETR